MLQVPAVMDISQPLTSTFRAAGLATDPRKISALRNNSTKAGLSQIAGLKNRGGRVARRAYPTTQRFCPLTLRAVQKECQWMRPVFKQMASKV